MLRLLIAATSASGSAAAVTFSDTVTLGGVVLGILVAGATLVGVMYGSKWRTTAEVNRANAEAWEATAVRLEDERDHARVEVQDLKHRVTKLELLPDLTAVLQKVGAVQEQLATALLEHDRSAEARSLRHEENAEKRADRIIEAVTRKEH